MHKSTNQGFTLVELSIVLVIIGLLVGGILVGKSMIKTAKVQNYVKTLQLYNVAIGNFKTNFRSEPGDFDKLIPPGDMDGGVWDANLGCTGQYTRNEMSQVFPHLSQAKMIEEDFQPFSSSSCGGTNDDNDSYYAGMNRPVFNKDSRYWNGTDKIGLYYVVSTPLTLGYRTRYFWVDIDCNDALAMDAKLDNGDKATGNFRFGDIITLCRFSWYPDGYPNQ